MRRCSIKPRTRKCIRRYRFLSLARKYKKKLLNTGLDFLKTASKKIVHETGELLGNKIVDGVTKSNNDQIVKHESV